MATVLPFKGILPQKDLADKIITYPADSYSLDEVKNILQKNELSYLSIIYPDFIDKQKTAPHSLERYNKIYSRFQHFLKNNYFVQDADPLYYVYQQQHPAYVFNGIIAAISVEDYLQQKIKIHEQTLSDREIKLKEYLKHCKINAEPVLFFYEKNKSLQELITNIQQQTPVIQIERDGIRHYLWKSAQREINDQIYHQFKKMPYLFIGDGHHRSASSVLLAKELGTSYKGAHYFLGSFFQEDSLKIFSFHRVLKNVVIPSNLLELVAKHFECIEVNNEYSLKQGSIGMYFDNKRYLLKFHSNTEALDTEILYQYILKDIFQIQDIRNNPNIEYLPEYTYSIQSVEHLVNEGKYNLAFFTASVSIDVIKKYALSNLTMPPKSTYILPKLLNALVLYSLENSME